MEAEEPEAEQELKELVELVVDPPVELAALVVVQPEEPVELELAPVAELVAPVLVLVLAEQEPEELVEQDKIHLTSLSQLSICYTNTIVVPFQVFLDYLMKIRLNSSRKPWIIWKML